MQFLKCEEIIKATRGSLLSGDESTEFSDISTDSRKIGLNDLFVPIIGERFDGHDFIEQSLERGAAGALTARDILAPEGKVVIKVEDTLKALGEVACYYRQKFNISLVGITGSVGKTSTKDMVAGVLGQKYNILKTEGNFNNEIGLPLTLFKLDSGHKAAVIEMGMSGFGEISRLTSIARPDVAIITNIGMSHIEKLGSRQNILRAKLEILEGLNRNGLVILNGDDSLLSGLKGMLDFRTVYYGTGDDVDYQAYNVQTAGESGTRFEVAVGNREYKVHVPVPGIHNVYNALAAIAAGMEFKVPMEKIVQGIGEFSPGKMRLNIISCNDIKIINDAYNASPQSMEAALGVLKDVGGKSRKVAVLGDMLEMGEWAHRAHVDVGKNAVGKGIDYLITVGEQGRNIAGGALEAGAAADRVYSFKSRDEAAEFLKSFVKSGDVILVKGSRGMKMEEIVNQLTNQ